MMRFGRREFLTSLPAGAVFRHSQPAWAESLSVRLGQWAPCTDLRPLADAANDGFRLEKRAMEIEGILSTLLDDGGLPASPNVSGTSPMPEEYTKEGPVRVARFGVSSDRFPEGMMRWIKSLGEVRRAQFHALPDDVVRYEIASLTQTGPEYRVGHWRMRWEGKVLDHFEPLDETVASAPAPLFADVTAELFGAVPSFRNQLAKGVPYWRSRLDSATGIGVYGNQGIAVGDVDGDGWDELYVCQPGGLPNRLYSRSEDGSWSDVTAEAGVGVLDDTAQALFLDLRNVGSQDLVVLTAGGPLLFLNDGAGRFRHHTRAFRFRTDARGTFAGMAAADYDRDGKVDLYLCAYLYFQSEDQYRYPAPYHDARNGPPNFLFRNELGVDGSGAFEDVTAASGLGHNNDRYSFAAAWCDYDEDGWPELYVANDFGRNNLYKLRDGRFQDIAEEKGVADIGPGMSAAWFDFDRDGRLDLFVTNMWTAAGQRVSSDPEFGPVKAGVAHSDFRGHTKGNSLYRNRGDGSFEYVGSEQGVEMGRWSWSGDGFDFDLDGTPEILVTTGMITHSADKDLCSFFWRQVVSKSPAEARPAQAYEEGWNCLNQLVRENYSWNGNEPNVFYRRNGVRYRDFSGVSGLDRALDSRAFAVTDFDGDGRPDLFLKSRLGPQVVACRNESSDRRKPLVLELEGTESNRDAIGAIIRVETDDGVSAQVLSGGSGYISQHTKRLHFGLGERAAARKVSILWPSSGRQELEGLEAGFRYHIREGDDAVARVPVEPAAAPRDAGAAVPSENRLVFEPTWFFDSVPLPVEVDDGLLVLTDGGSPRPPAGVPHTAIDLSEASGEQVAAFAIFRRYLFDYRADLELPIALLVRSGAMRKIYPSVPDEAELREDIEAIRAGRSPRALALPFAGRYYGRPARRHFRMGFAFMQAGYPHLAIPYLREAARTSRDNFKAWLAYGQADLQAGNLQEAERSLRKAANLNADSAELWNNLGGVAMAREEFLGALEHFQKALAIDGNLAYALVNAAQAHSRTGNEFEAERLLRRALEVDPSDAEAANKLGLICARQGRLSEARALFQQAIESKRDHAEAINNLAVSYIQSGQFRDAIAAFRFGIEQVPDFESFYMNLARVYADLGDYARSREVLKSLLERNPAHSQASRALLQIQGR